MSGISGHVGSQHGLFPQNMWFRFGFQLEREYPDAPIRNRVKNNRQHLKIAAYVVGHSLQKHVVICCDKGPESYGFKKAHIVGVVFPQGKPFVSSEPLGPLSHGNPFISSWQVVGALVRCQFDSCWPPWAYFFFVLLLFF